MQHDAPLVVVLVTERQPAIRRLLSARTHPQRKRIGLRDDRIGGDQQLSVPLTVPLMGLPLVPITVSEPADTKLFVRGTTATRKGHSAQIAAAMADILTHRWADHADPGMVSKGLRSLTYAE